MAVFGIPAVHEDDALRAVRAVAELRQEIEALNAELEKEQGVRIRLRTGVNTGEVVAGDSAEAQMLVTGDAVNVAARLEQAAAPGEILIGEATRRLVSDAVRVEEVGAARAQGKGGRRPLLAAPRGLRGGARLRAAPGYSPGRARGRGRPDAPGVRPRRRAAAPVPLHRAGPGRDRQVAAGRRARRGPRGPRRGPRRGAACRTGTASPSGRSTRSSAELAGETDDPRPAIAQAVGDAEAAPVVAERVATAVGRSEGAASTRRRSGPSGSSSRRSPASGRSCSSWRTSTGRSRPSST